MAIATKIYDSTKEQITDSETGEVVKLYCGQEMDSIGLLIAMVAFDPSQAQKAYIEIMKLVYGVKK